MVTVVMGILASIAALKFSEMREKAFVSSLKSDLRNLSSAQEAYFSFNYTYSDDIAALEFTETEAVHVTVNEATASGWSATARHSGLGTRRCGVFYGSAAPSGGSPATIPGRIACS